MSRKPVVLVLLVVIFLGLFVFWVEPFAVSSTVKMWLRWQGKRQGLSVEIGKIQAPWLRPIVIENLRIASADNAPCRVELKAKRTLVGLKFAGLRSSASVRLIQQLNIDQLSIETVCHAPQEKEKSRLSWPTLAKLLPESFKIDNFDLRVENAATVVLVHRATISASPIAAGHFQIGELSIASPLFHQTFSDLHGTAGWHDNRLVLGGFVLADGLNAQAITTDLSHLGKQNVGIDFDIDAFSGKLRASVANEWRDQQSNWNVAGSATSVSLAQTSQAFGFAKSIGGMVHACKFTFRGNTRDLAHSTASIWLELTGSSWMGRTSEVIMLGAALYNRQIQLQQFYIKQRNNQLTMSGEGAIPSTSADWLSPDFRADISASIHDLGDFAGLFGAQRGDFAGEIAGGGTMNARDRKIGGQLALSGTSVTLFKTSIDSLNTRLNLRAPELEIEQFELKRKGDSFVAQGKIDMSHEHSYSGTIRASVKNVADYLSIFRGPSTTESKPASAQFEAKIDAANWDAHGVLNIAGSSPLTFSATFPLRIGSNWSAFMAAPVKLDLDFPSIFLASAPRFLHSEIFQDGILSGKISLSGNLQHPQLTGDAQLSNGKMQNAPMNLTASSGRVAFNGDRASIDFLNASTKNIDISLRGDVDLRDSSNIIVDLFTLAPMFDATASNLDCANRIELVPANLSLAPPILELEFRGGIARPWDIVLKRAATKAPDALNEVVRTVRLCPGAGPAEKVLSLATQARPSPSPGRKKSKRGH